MFMAMAIGGTCVLSVLPGGREKGRGGRKEEMDGGRQPDRKTLREGGREANRQTDRHTDRQTCW